MTEKNDAPVLIYATFPDVETAKAAGGDLVRSRLAACVNVLPEMISVYRWQGEVENDREVVMIAKTRGSLVDKVTAQIVAAHPYDLPAVVAIPVVGGSAAFCDWILQETDPAAE